MSIGLSFQCLTGSVTSLREKLIKLGAKVVSDGRYVTFQMAEVAVSRQMCREAGGAAEGRGGSAVGQGRGGGQGGCS